MSKIKLKKLPARIYSGKFLYLVALCRRAGRKGVYNVYVLSSEDPVTIGRELPLRNVRELIAKFDSLCKVPWYGDKETVLLTVADFMAGP